VDLIQKVGKGVVAATTLVLSVAIRKLMKK